ncbi:hypothetical protein GF386_00810 [Candidatus Pacearchaeota archaeon]|nr:hypothetical protein [Candidatus Pacearchaeota archaeon]MBD3282798.1 hypothetical protein [Candidatus Pacearchaeota archaeon]
MLNEDALERIVYVVSLYDYAVYDPAEHIAGFYSSRENAERQRALMIEAGLHLPKYDGPSDDFHITSRTLRQIIEGARKANSETLGDYYDLGYGEIAVNGHDYEYPWSRCYMNPEEILTRLDEPADIRRFLPQQDNYPGFDTSGFDGWLNPDEELWFRTLSIN